MTREEAKEYLSAIQAHGADAGDPIFQEALEQAKKDSELGAWLAQQQEFDRILLEKFSSIQPPEGLRENILASLEEKVRPIQFWKKTWLALAATIALAALLLNEQIGFFRGPSSSFRSFCSDALAMVEVKPAPKLDLETPSLDTAEAFIDQREAPRLDRFPPRLRAMDTAGCRVFVWRQHPASLTCFRMPSGKLLHLIVIREDAVGGSNMPSGPYSENGWHLMFQKKDGLVVMWASQAPMEQLKEVLLET